MKKKGQGILDYVVLLIVVITALLVVSYYIRNVICGKFRDGADVFGQGETYQPGSTTVTIVK